MLTSLLIAALPQGAAALAEAELVLDINSSQTTNSLEDSDPRLFREFGNSVLFVASGVGLGAGLWRLPAAGEPVQVTTPPQGGTSSIAVLDASTAVLASTTPSAQRSLLVTDGTTIGTFVLEDLFEGGAINPRTGPIAVEGRAWFSTDPPGAAIRIGSTDGTQAGTELEFEVSSGPGASANVIYHPAAGGVFLSVFEQGLRSLVFSAGTGEAPVSLGEVKGAGSPGGLVDDALEFKGALWFAADGPAGEGQELWRSDGTVAGTSMFLDLSPVGGSSPRLMARNAERLYFSALGADGSYGLWVTEGTPASTALVTDQVSFPAGGEFLDDGTFLFSSVVAGTTTLWTTDGTGPGTQLLTTIPTGGATEFEKVGPLIYFCRPVVSSDAPLWVTDGTVAGTVQLGELRTFFNAEPFGSALGQLFFSRRDFVNGAELWTSSGTPATTLLEANIAVEEVNDSSNPEGWARLGGRAVFAAAETAPSGQVGDREVWITDGTPGGTAMVADLVPGTGGSKPTIVGELGGRVLFIASTPQTGAELWATDGTASGTVLLADAGIGSTHSAPIALVRAEGAYFFVAESGPGPLSRRLWRTDGTLEGTAVVAPNLELTGSAGLLQFGAALGSSLVFAKSTPEIGSEPWISDGTEGGTVPLADLVPGPEGSGPRGFASVGPFVYFNAYRPDIGFELFRTDGTPGGTGLVVDFEQGSLGSYPDNLHAAGERVVFRVTRPDFPREVGVSDGTVAGTLLLEELEPALLGTSAEILVQAGERVAFQNAGQTGFWVTDGEPGGTHLVDVPGATDFSADLGRPLIPSGDGEGLFFSATDELGGAELWWWRGPGLAVERVVDLHQGFASSDARLLGELGGALLLAGAGPEIGDELYRIDLLDLGLFGAELVGSPCGSGSYAKIGFSGAVAPGETLELLVSDAPALQPALAFYDAGISLVPLGSGCVSYLLAPTLLGATATGPEGAAAVSIDLPDNPALVGVLAAAQWVVAEPGGPLAGALALSDALELVLGQ